MTATTATTTPGISRALGQGECDRYSLRVRQHADGRVLVYGVRDAAIAAWGQPAYGEDWRGGVLLAAGEDIAGAATLAPPPAPNRQEQSS